MDERNARVPRRNRLDGSLAAKLPFVGPLARWFAAVSSRRAGRVPVGLLTLLPIALLLDLFDAADELALGPVGMLVSFVLESAFLLGVTGRTGYAVGLAGVDLVPGLDILPMATLTLLAEIARAWNEDGAPGPAAAGKGPVIDV